VKILVLKGNLTETVTEAAVVAHFEGDATPGARPHSWTRKAAV